MKKIVLILCLFFAHFIETKAQSLSEIVNDKETLLIDVRTPEEFSKGSVTNAINVPIQEIEKYVALFQDKKNIVIFCRSGNRSAKAIKFLQEKGIENLYDGKIWQDVENLIQKKENKMTTKEKEQCHKNFKN